MNKGPISQFIAHHYRHFNAASLIDAAKGYDQHLLEGGKMMITLAGAMSSFTCRNDPTRKSRYYILYRSKS